MANQIAPVDPARPIVSDPAAWVSPWGCRHPSARRYRRSDMADAHQCADCGAILEDGQEEPLDTETTCAYCGNEVAEGEDIVTEDGLCHIACLAQAAENAREFRRGGNPYPRNSQAGLGWTSRHRPGSQR